MKKMFLLFLLWLAQGCVISKPESFAVIDSDKRSYLKEMKFKDSFRPEMNILIDKNTVYYRYYENKAIDLKLHSGLRFFKTGQYIGYGSREELDYFIFTKLNKGGIGYYNSKINDSIIIIEKPNLIFRRAGKRNFDKYKVLPNGDLKSITKQASDYGGIYKKIPLSENSLEEFIPDW